MLLVLSLLLLLSTPMLLPGAHWLLLLLQGEVPALASLLLLQLRLPCCLCSLHSSMCLLQHVHHC